MNYSVEKALTLPSFILPGFLRFYKEIFSCTINFGIRHENNVDDQTFVMNQVRVAYPYVSDIFPKIVFFFVFIYFLIFFFNKPPSKTHNSKVDDLRRGWPESSFFNSYYTKG